MTLVSFGIMDVDLSYSYNYTNNMTDYQHIYLEAQFGPTYFRYPGLYQQVVEKFPDGSHFVEIGAFLGKSSSYMCIEIANSGKNIKFDVVDHWDSNLLPQRDGSEFEDVDGIGFPIRDEVRKQFQNAASFLPGYWDNLEVQEDRLYEAFLSNMEPVSNFFTPIKMKSLDAAKLYDNESLDFVMIDAAHDYKNVCDDIDAWLPKMKKGGIFSGDDWRYPTVEAAVRKKLEGRFKIDVDWSQNYWKVEL